MNQLELLHTGAAAWNRWRQENPGVPVDLEGADIGDLKLEGVNLQDANLQGAKLRWAYLRKANLKNAQLSYADLRIADLSRANLAGASLVKARLEGAYFREADLTRADLRSARLIGVNFDDAILRGANFESANLRNCVLVDVDLRDAKLRGVRVFGASVWNVKAEGSEQRDILISAESEPDVMVDDLELAQFIHLLLDNKKLRNVIDTVTSKVVLILGRFSKERKPVLDELKRQLRERSYVPVLFDFEGPWARDFIETVSTIAHMAKFVVADTTDARIVLEEIPHIVRNLAVPVQPIIEGDIADEPVTLFNLRRNHRSVLETFAYSSTEQLVRDLVPRVIQPAERLAAELRGRAL